MPKKAAAKKPAVAPEKEAAAPSGEAIKMDFAAGVLDSIRSKLGDDSAMLLGSDGLAIKIRGVISTQCATIDAAIGRGGIPRSRLTLLHGKEGSGKTSLALHIVAETQRLGGVAVYIDKEYKLDPDYARAIGVNINQLVLAQPPHLESVFATCEGVIERAAALRQGGERIPILIVLDSMNAAITKAQYEGAWEDKHMAPQARVYSELLPKLMPKVSKEDVALLWISQVRKKMVMFGDDAETAGGNAPKFYASLLLDVRRVASDKDKDGARVANKLVVECKKNQIAPPFRKADVVIDYGHGINGEIALLTQGVADGIVEKSGHFYIFGKYNLGNGLANAAKKLKEDETLRWHLHDELYKRWD